MFEALGTVIYGFDYAKLFQKYWNCGNSFEKTIMLCDIEKLKIQMLESSCTELFETMES